MQAPDLRGYNYFCRIPAAEPENPKSGKGPEEPGWQKNPLREWPSEWPGNVGVCTGHPHGEGWLAVVDVDHEERLTPELRLALSQHPTFTVRTGSGGTHAYYLCAFQPSADAKFPNQDPLKKAGEVKGMGGQVVAPGSLHYTGKYYTIERDLPFAPLPREFYEYVKPYGQARERASASACEQTRTLTGEDLRNYAQRNWQPNHPQYALLLNIAAGRAVSGPGQRHQDLEINLTKALVGEFGPEITDESVIALLAPSYPSPMPAASRNDIVRGLNGARAIKLAERAVCPLPAPVRALRPLTPMVLADASRKLTKRADQPRREILRDLSNGRAPIDHTEGARVVLLSLPGTSDEDLRAILPEADIAAARAEVAEVAAKAETAAKLAAAKAEAKLKAEERKLLKVEKSVAQLHALGIDDLERNDKGDVDTTPYNIKRLLDATVSGFKNRRTGDLRVATPWGGEVNALDATSTTITAAAWYQQHFGIKIPYQTIERMLMEAAQSQVRDLIQERAAGLVWDGTPRLDTAGDILLRRQDKYARTWLKSLLLGIAERVLNPGCEMDRCWILKGGQKAGKTTLFDEVSRVMTGYKAMRVISGNDDDLRKRHTGVIALDDEMSAYKGDNKGEYKSWISTDSTLIRAPYARAAERTACGFVYAATSNYDTSLDDPTGARRFVVLELPGDDRHETVRYDQAALFAILPQLLAEALATVRAHGTGCAEAVLDTSKQEVQAAQDATQHISEEAAVLAEAFASPDVVAAARLQVPEGKVVDTPLANAQIDALLGLPGPRSRQQSRAIKDAMTMLGWRFKQMWADGKPSWRWVKANK